YLVYLPALDGALELVGTLVPVRAEEAADAVCASGVSTVAFHPASLVAAARLCGRSVSFAIEGARDGDWVVEASAADNRRAHDQLAAQCAQRFGAVSLGRFLATAEAGGVVLPAGQARPRGEAPCGGAFPRRPG